MPAFGHLVSKHDDADLTRAFDRDATRPQLFRFGRLDDGDGLRGRGDFTILLRNVSECFNFVEAADHGDDRVLWPVVGVVKFTQFFDRGALDI